MEFPVICDRCLRHAQVEHVKSAGEHESLFLVTCHGETKMVRHFLPAAQHNKRVAYLWGDLHEHHVTDEDLAFYETRIDECKRMIAAIKRVTRRL